MADRQAAATRLGKAVRERESICVFGDYDCDGITSAAIITHALRHLGARVEVTLANRFDGGYGVSLPAVNRIREKCPTLLVTCDCGSSDAENLRALASTGIESIVIDHHLVPSDPLPAVAFLNPHRSDCGFAYKNLASCGLALSVVAALRAELNLSLDLHAYLDLVAIGTIADVAPLDGDNRILVRAGLQRIAEGARPGLRALLDRARIEPGVSVSGEDVAFRIAPRLNAPGRISSPEVSLELLLAEDAASAEQLADRIEQLQRERRNLQDKMLAEALVEIEAEAWQNDAGIVVGSETWSSGIVGILAGKLAEHFGIPVIAIGFDGDIGRGSVRAPKGVPLYDILQGLSDCLLRFGGHQAAAGLDVRIDQVATLRARFNRACASHSSSERASNLATEDAPLPIDSEDDVFQVAHDLALFEPCGEGNRQPLLLASGKLIKAREVRGGHLQLELETSNGQKLRAFGFGLGAAAGGLPGALGIVGTMRVSRYQSLERAEMRIERLATEGNLPNNSAQVVTS
jgi:single-stranded-DNA-specific exonuclease